MGYHLMSVLKKKAGPFRGDDSNTGAGVKTGDHFIYAF